MRARIELADGSSHWGAAAELLAPKWFDKNLALSNEDNFEQLRRALALAIDAYTAPGRPRTAFGHFAAHYEAQIAAGAACGLNPLVASFGPAQIDRAVLDALCRSAGCSFYDAMQVNLPGIDPALLPAQLADLAGFDMRQFLAAADAGGEHRRPPHGRSGRHDRRPSARGRRRLAGIARGGRGGLWPHLLQAQGRRRGRRRPAAPGARSRRCSTASPSPYHVSLDGNEQYDDLDALLDLWRRMQASPRLQRLVASVLFIEQPINRKHALDTDVSTLSRVKPVIIDESDAELGAFPAARALGYAGVSSKCCKGLYKSILNAARCTMWNAEAGGERYFMSGEDLTTQAGLAVQQDLALVNLLGLTHVERNGHHYVNGMAGLPQHEQDGFLAAHPDLYERSHGAVRLQDPRRAPGDRLARGRGLRLGRRSRLGGAHAARVRRRRGTPPAPDDQRTMEIIATSTSTEVRAAAPAWTRWGQLVLGIVCMAMIANLQYSWTLFIDPIDQKHQWGRAALQVTFTIFIVTETCVVPLVGHLIDRFGPRVLVCCSGVLVATSWAINSIANSLALLYLAAVIAGFGAGPIFSATFGNALKWFPDRRGLAAGLTAAGFGAGAALMVVPIASTIQSSGYEAAYLWFGLGQGLVIVLAALRLRAPRPGEVVATASALVQQSTRDYAAAHVLRSPPFWLMYAMFVMVGTGGLMATAQLAPVARDFAIDGVPVSILGITMPALQFRVVARPRVQRPVAAVLRLGVRPDRPREHDVHRLPAGGHRHLRAALVREQPDSVRVAGRTGLPRLGRDFCAVPGDLHRHLRQEVRGHQLRHALHRQGHGRAPGPVGQRADRRNRQLDRRIRGGLGAQYRGGGVGVARVEADAETKDGGRKLNDADLSASEAIGAVANS